MNLFRLHAYELSPRRTADVLLPVSGGAFPISGSIRTSLLDLQGKTGLTGRPEVNFRSVAGAPGGTPHPVRELILRFAFSASASAATASLQLSERLADKMDLRSPPSLLVLTCLRSTNLRRVILWAFPQESGFQLRRGPAGARIRLLTNIFSHSSRLRKAALFDGASNTAGEFLGGRIVDLQAEGASGTGADYWVDQFLDCELALSSTIGTRRLAKYLRAAHDAATEKADRDQIINAITAIRTMPRPSWNFRAVAQTFLSGSAHADFLNRIPSRERTLTFRLDRTEFEEKLNFRVFETERGIFISAPFGTIGNGVQLTGTAQQRIRVDDVVAEEHVRARRA